MSSAPERDGASARLRPAHRRSGTRRCSSSARSRSFRSPTCWPRRRSPSAIIRSSTASWASTPPLRARRARALADTVQAEQRTAPERLFVRVVDRGAEAIVSACRKAGMPRARDGVAAARRRDARAGREEHRGAPRSARALSRGARAGHAVDRVVALDRRMARHAIGRQADPPADRGRAAHHRHRPHRRAGAASPSTDDAIDELTALFNAMLDKIEGLVHGMRGALDNVSHDLRTPLTRLRGTAELALAASARHRPLSRGAGRLRRGERPRAGDAQHADGHHGSGERRDAAAARAGGARRRRRRGPSISIATSPTRRASRCGARGSTGVT